LLALFGATAARASDELSREYRIKAAYLYNLIKFVTWPDETTMAADSPLTLCVYGYNPFGSYLERLESRRVRNRSLEVRYVAERQSSAGCHLLFISQHNTRAPSVLRNVRQPSSPATDVSAATVSLTVGDDADFLSHGGLIALVDIANNIQLDINLTQARQLGLQVSANLLEIARRVE
jgi:hypothetical protein